MIIEDELKYLFGGVVYNNLYCRECQYYWPCIDCGFGYNRREYCPRCRDRTDIKWLCDFCKNQGGYRTYNGVWRTLTRK